jgi:hypothetical protein
VTALALLKGIFDRVRCKLIHRQRNGDQVRLSHTVAPAEDFQGNKNMARSCLEIQSCAYMPQGAFQAFLGILHRSASGMGEDADTFSGPLEGVANLFMDRLSRLQAKHRNDKLQIATAPMGQLLQQ